MKSIVKNNAFLSPFATDFFDELFPRHFFDVSKNASWSRVLVPAVNIEETDTGFEIDLAAPGFKKEDFSIQIDDDVLTISTEEKCEKEEKTKRVYTRREYSLSAFNRSFTLPKHTVDRENISAKYVDGILKLGVLKLPEAKVKAKKTIAID